MSTRAPRLRLAVLIAALALSAPWTAASAESPYNRDQWLKRWADTDGDCQNTRHEVLRRQSLVAVTLDARGCRVLAGLWLDPYTGQHHTDPSLLDIDHLVPLAEAHQSGGDKWNARRRARFANDLATPGALVAVARGVNRSKGMRDPGRWLPDVGRCDYVKHWLAVKAAYDLALDPQEAAAIQQVRETDCRG